MLQDTPIRAASVAQVCRLVSRNSKSKLLLLCMVDHWWHGWGEGGHLPPLEFYGEIIASFWKVTPVSDERVSFQRLKSGGLSAKRLILWSLNFTNYTGRR